MKKILFILPAVFVLFSCTKWDNYAEPAAALEGTVIDLATGQPLRTEQPNGFRVRYKEIAEEYPSAQYYYFQGKADGTFKNTKMFAATYELTPVEGAFITPAPQTVTLKDGTNPSVTFSVTPYLTISSDKISVNTSTKTLHAEFKISQPSGSSAVPKQAFVSVTWNPNVSYYTYGTGNNKMVANGGRMTKNVGAADLDTVISFDIDMTDMTPGHTWYVRMGRTSDKNANRANFSDIFTFEY